MRNFNHNVFILNLNKILEKCFFLSLQTQNLFLSKIFVCCLLASKIARIKYSWWKHTIKVRIDFEVAIYCIVGIKENVMFIFNSCLHSSILIYKALRVWKYLALKVLERGLNFTSKRCMNADMSLLWQHSGERKNKSILTMLSKKILHSQQCTLCKKQSRLLDLNDSTLFILESPFS